MLLTQHATSFLHNLGKKRLRLRRLPSEYIQQRKIVCIAPSVSE
jgi:hypothetical protein